MSYAYDTFGNLTSLGGTAIAVDHGTNRLAGGAVYDGRGNMTDQPMGTWTRRLRWDEENRLLAAWAQGAGAPLGIWAFAYDHEGERVLKYRIDAGAVAEAELYLRDEQGNVLTELDWVDTGAGGYWARAKDHVYLGRDLIGSLDSTDGAPHIVTYARDHLGTQRAEVWALGTAATTDLWPYGAVANTKLLGDAPPLANGAHLFTGHERDFMGTEADPLEGLDYMHARYYSHQLGRFLSVDPVGGSVGLSQSWNRYGYSVGSPVKLIDPLGLAHQDPNDPRRWIGDPEDDVHVTAPDPEKEAKDRRRAQAGIWELLRWRRKLERAYRLQYSVYDNPYREFARVAGGGQPRSSHQVDWKFFWDGVAASTDSGIDVNLLTFNYTKDFHKFLTTSSWSGVGTNIQPFVLGGDVYLGDIWNPTAYDASSQILEIGIWIPGLSLPGVGLLVGDGGSIVGVRLHLGETVGLSPSLTSSKSPSDLF